MMQATDGFILVSSARVELRPRPTSDGRAAAMAGAEVVIALLRAQMDGSHERVVDTFKRWDKDKSGSVDIKEFRAIVSALGIEEMETAVDGAFRALDSDRSGVITYTELREAMRRRTETQVRRARQQETQKPIPLSAVQLSQRDAFLAKLKVDRILRETVSTEAAAQAHVNWEQDYERRQTARKQANSLTSQRMAANAAAVESRIGARRRQEAQEREVARSTFSAGLLAAEATWATRSQQVANEEGRQTKRLFQRAERERERRRKQKDLISDSTTRKQKYEATMNLHDERVSIVAKDREAALKSKTEALEARLARTRQKLDETRRRELEQRAAVSSRLSAHCAKVDAALERRLAAVSERATELTLKRAETASAALARKQSEMVAKQESAKLALSRSAEHLGEAREQERQDRAKRSADKAAAIRRFMDGRAREDHLRETRTRAIADGSSLRILELKEKKQKAEQELQARTRKAIHISGYLSEVEHMSRSTTRLRTAPAEVEALLSRANLA